MRWLNRAVIVAPHLTLCGTEEEYLKVVKFLKVRNPDIWLRGEAGATTHTFTKADKITCVVTLDFSTCKDQLLHEIVGILAHEATHVCQKLYESIGEHHPSSELEAYAIQVTTQRLVEEFLRRNIKYKKQSNGR